MTLSAHTAVPSHPSRRSVLGWGAATSLAAIAAPGCALLDRGTTVDPSFFAIVTNTSGLPPSGVVVADEAVLITPGFGVQLTTVSTTTRLSGSRSERLSNAPEGTIRAPEDHELLIVGLEGLVPGFTDMTSAKVVVASGSQHHDLGRPFGAFLEPELQWDRRVSGFCMCVRTGEPVQLLVTDQGKTASLDLRAAKRTDDADTHANDLYLSRPELHPPSKPVKWHGLARTKPKPGYEIDTSDMTVSIDFIDTLTWVSPFGGEKWVRPGHQWLSLGLKTKISLEGPPLGLETTFAKAFVLKAANGETYGATGGDVDLLAWLWDQPLTNVMFEVPPSVTEGEVTINFNGPLVTRYTDGSVPAAFLDRDKPLVIPIRSMPV